MFRRRYPFILPARVRLIHRLLACCHYRISVTGTPCRGKPVLFIVSHRSGASDGTVAAYVLGGVPSLVSVQLVRNPRLRLLFDGIPVVRDKDRERYGITADSVPPPLVSAGARCPPQPPAGPPPAPPSPLSPPSPPPWPGCWPAW